MLPRLRVLSFLLLTAWLAGTSGCVTAPHVDPARGARLILSPSGDVVFLGRSMPLEAVSKALRRVDVRPQQEIYVEIDDPHDMPRMQHVTTVLASGGYRCMTFVAPRHVSAEVTDASARKADAPAPRQAP